MNDVDVHMQSESFRAGWVAGFYGLSSESSNRLDRIARFGAKGGADTDFVAGYHYALRVRARQVDRPSAVTIRLLVDAA